ncbi:hypothetical protein BIFBRE_04044 [Bifidobacterium breve DSM 20213 = JCM 1192]|uniref:Uncharacterized protein n=1 Tax=Bifidobacterium breve DSM 20213 = JCM 1192 TaxID=518634 RepID=D4BPM9_BIFBR|nr:hypothetical protein BIFBRE_04044 [Bifidobacterium breve DSM 20213 = JCM 1192]
MDCRLRPGKGIIRHRSHRGKAWTLRLDTYETSTLPKREAFLESRFPCGSMAGGISEYE